MTTVKSNRGRKRSFSDPFLARQAAVALVRHAFDTTKAMAVVRPHYTTKSCNTHGWKLLHEPAVVREIEKIMNKSERNADKFLGIQWGNVERFQKIFDEMIAKGDEPPKWMIEVWSNSNRVLARGYVNDKGETGKPGPTMTFGNIQESELANLTGSMEKKNVQ